MFRRVAVALVCAWLITFSAAPAFAYRFWGCKPLGMGGAFTAVADDDNAISWNPAGLTIFNTLNKASFMFNWERHQYLLGDFPFTNPDAIQTTSDNSFYHNGTFFDDTTTVNLKKEMIRDWYRAAIVDGYTTKVLVAGLAFTSLNFPNRTFRDGTDYSADLAIAGGGDYFSMGTTLRYVSTLQPGTGEFDMDLGVMIKPGGFMGIGLVGRNIFGNDHPRLVRREVALGLAGFLLDYATVAFDITKVFDVTDVPGTFVYAIGVEGIVAKVLALRSGFNWDLVDNTRMYSVGIGYVDPLGSLTYTFQGSVDEIRDFAHSLQVSINFP